MPIYTITLDNGSEFADFKGIEAKWQQRWDDEKSFKTLDDYSMPKYYALVEFPYPSGAGMHVGHIKAYSGLEVVSRKRGSTSADFLDWFQQYGQTRAAKSTRSHFDYIWRLLYSYMKERGMHALMFQDITYTFLVTLG